MRVALMAAALLFGATVAAQDIPSAMVLLLSDHPDRRLDTLALDADFSRPLPKDWLGGCPNGADGSQTDLSDYSGHIWYNNIWWDRTHAACTTRQVYDPSVGKMVLDLSWTDRGNSYDDYLGHVLQTTDWWGGGNGVTLPNSAYYEVVMRLEPVVSGVRFTLNTWSLSNIISQGAVTEWGIIEVSSDEGPFGNIHNFGGDPNYYIWTGRDDFKDLHIAYDIGLYHRIGLRVTSDGHQAVGCGFVDGIFIRCERIDLVGREPTQRLFLMLQSHCDVWLLQSECPMTGKLQHAYVQYVRVWSCRDWKTQECDGSLMYGFR